MSRYLKPTLILVGAAVLPFVITGNFRHNIMALMAAYAIAGIGLNLLVGVAGQISLGHGAFMSIGGYATAFLTLKAGLPPWVAVPAAGVITALAGLLLGLPALRLHGHFLALATLSFGAAIPQIALKWNSVTGGAMGLSPARFPSDRVAYWVILGVLAVLIWVAYNVMESRLGRALLALRDSEIAAQAMGVDLAKAKTGVFALSAFYAGVAGALATHLSGFISPVNFGVLYSFTALAAIVVGGIGSIPGSIYGSVLLVFLNFSLSKTQGWASALEGLAIIGIIMFLPNGLVSLGRKLKGVGRRAAT